MAVKPPSFSTIVVITIVESIFLLCADSNAQLLGLGGSLSFCFRLFLLNTTIWGVYRAEIYPRFFSDLCRLPKAKGGIPLVGYGPTQFSTSRGKQFLHMSKSVPNAGLVCFQGFLNREHILLTTGEALSEVLMRRSYDFQKPPAARSLFRRLLGNSLVIAEGDEHRTMRKGLQPFFNFGQIQELSSVFWSKAIDMTRAIKDSVPFEVEEEIVADLHVWANRATLDAIGLAALGKDFGTLREEHVPQLLRLYDTLTTTRWDIKAVFTCTAFLPRWTLKLIPGGIDERITNSNAALRRVCREFLEDRKRDLDDESHKDILLQLIRSGRFSEDDLVDHLLTIIAGGYDPTASAFTWAIWCLCSHSSWQTRLRDELTASIPFRYFSSDVREFPATQVLENCPILNAVCSEVFRFLPTTPLTTRVAARDTIILGNPVPKGTKIFISPWAINRHSDFFGPTADEFDPGRWLDETGKFNNNGGASSNYAFMTFLQGPRKCLGHRYAQTEVRAFVAALVGCFEFEMADKTHVPRLAGMVATKPEGGLKVRLRPVERW